MDAFLAVSAVLVIAATLSTRLAQRFGVPALVLFVGIGMLAGSSGPGGIHFDDYALSYRLGLVALAVIIYSGGLDTEGSLFRASVLPAGLLATVGVILTAAFIGLFAWWLTPLGLFGSVLLGAVLAPTDAAAVFSVLKGQGLSRRLRGILETESATNDPIAIYLTVALTTLATSGQLGVGGVLAGAALQLALGALYGWLMGKGLAWLINRTRSDSFGLYPVLALAGGLLSYALANLLAGNGFLAIYATGLVLGNSRLSHRQNIRAFMDAAAWGAQITMFLLLGLLAFPDRLLPQLPWAILVSAALLFVARPLTVVLVLEPLRRLTGRHAFGAKEYAFLSWAGLKGAVPIILAIVPLLNAVPQGELLFNLVFVAVIVGTTLQGLTIVPLARWLGLSEPEPPQPPLRVELGGAAPPGSAAYDVFLTEAAPAVGRALRELPLPEQVVVAAIYRENHLLTPRGDFVFRPGDHVFLISERADAVGIPEVFASPRRS